MKRRRLHYGHGKQSIYNVDHKMSRFSDEHFDDDLSRGGSPEQYKRLQSDDDATKSNSSLQGLRQQQASQVLSDKKHRSIEHVTSKEFKKDLEVKEVKLEGTMPPQLEPRATAIRQKDLPNGKQLSLLDLEAKFQMECDNLLVSITQDWNTLNQVESGKIDASTMKGLDMTNSIDEQQVGSDVGSEQVLQNNSMASSHNSMPLTFT